MVIKRNLVQINNNLRSILGLILRIGREGLLYILFIMMLIISLTNTFVNKLSTLRNAIVLLLGFCVRSICISSWVDFKLYLAGRCGVISSFKVFVRW